MAMYNDLSASVKADLVAFNSAFDGCLYLVLGDTTLGDSPVRAYYYVAASTATADGESILSATGMGGTGRYIKTVIGQAPKRQETYSGTTDSSGNYSISFTSSFPTAPNIQANIVGGSNTQIIKITSVTSSGFTVNVTNRTDVVGLLPSYSNVNGASVDVLIIQK